MIERKPGVAEAGTAVTKAVKPAKIETAPTESLLFGIPVPPRPDSKIPIVTPDTERMKKPGEYTWSKVQTGVNDFATAITERANRINPQAKPAKLAVTPPPAGINSDFGIACFPLAPALRLAPVQIASELAAGFNTGEKPLYISKAEAAGPFLNFKIDYDVFGKAVLDEIESMGDHYGEQNIGDGKVVIVDFASPNIAKEMSVAHLRSTDIGWSLVRILRALGYTVIGDNHLGDWGSQFGMLARAYELWKDEFPELESKDKATQVKGLYKLYVRINKEVARQKGPKGNKKSDLEVEGRRWFELLEHGDKEAKELWKWTYDLSLAEFERVLDLLGVKHEYALGESEFVPMSTDIVNRLIDLGIAQEIRSRSRITKKVKSCTTVTFKETSGGKLEIIRHKARVPKTQKLKLVLYKSDGTTTYAIRDLGCFVTRCEWFKPESVIYVVGGEQETYFRGLFAILRKWSDGKVPEAVHVNFGEVKILEEDESGEKKAVRMSTRRGNVIILEDFINGAIAKVRTKIEDRQKDLPDDKRLSDKEITTIARQVGVGAVIYFDLRRSREANVTFDWDEALSLEGNTGPYLQYTYARACSILGKVRDEEILASLEGGVHHETDEDKKTIGELRKRLVKELGMFPEAISQAALENQPFKVAEATYRIADTFNSFYKLASVVDCPDVNERAERVRLTSATAQVIKNGLNLLGIEAPRKM